jgi:hypothetical protein
LEKTLSRRRLNCSRHPAAGTDAGDGTHIHQWYMMLLMKAVVR